MAREVERCSGIFPLSRPSLLAMCAVRASCLAPLESCWACKCVRAGVQ